MGKINPPHYQQGKIETIDVIEQIVKDYDPPVAYNIGSVLKYIARAPYKYDTPIDDLRKALWFLERAIRCQVSSTAGSTLTPANNGEPPAE